MKTNFDNAVKILMEGRCEAIKPGNDTNSIILCDDGSVSKVLTWKTGVGETSIPCTYVLGQWECLGYKPKMETVEIKRWGIVNDSGKCLNSYAQEDTAIDHIKSFSTPQCPLHVIPLSGTYQRPVKEKVKRREEIQLREAERADAFYRSGIEFNGPVKFFAEWEE